MDGLPKLVRQPLGDDGDAILGLRASAAATQDQAAEQGGNQDERTWHVRELPERWTADRCETQANGRSGPGQASNAALPRSQGSPLRPNVDYTREVPATGPEGRIFPKIPGAAVKTPFVNGGQTVPAIVPRNAAVCFS